MSQFATALELATLLNGTTDEADLSPEWIAQANLLLELISDDVESAGGVRIEAATVTVLLGGSWSRDLELPAGPVRSVDSVALDGFAMDPSGYTWNSRSLLRRGAGSSINSASAGDAYPGSLQGAGHRSGLSWGGPGSTVEVVYGPGFDDVPGFVRSLVLRIAARSFGNVGNVTQESLAVYSVTYGKSTTDDGSSFVTESERRRLRHALGARSAGTFDTAGR